MFNAIAGGICDAHQTRRLPENGRDLSGIYPEGDGIADRFEIIGKVDEAGGDYLGLQG